MIKKERTFRLKIILLNLILVAFFSFTLWLNFLLGAMVAWLFYSSFLIGMAFGIVFCLYLSKIWDPERLALKKTATNSPKNSNGWLWGIPLGVLLGNIVSQFMGTASLSVFMGIFFGWFYIVMIYMGIQVWKYRPRD